MPSMVLQTTTVRPDAESARLVAALPANCPPHPPTAQNTSTTARTCLKPQSRIAVQSYGVQRVHASQSPLLHVAHVDILAWLHEYRASHRALPGDFQGLDEDRVAVSPKSRSQRLEGFAYGWNARFLERAGGERRRHRSALGRPRGRLHVDTKQS